MTLIMTWLYYLKACHGNRRASLMKPLKAEATRLKNSEMDRNWLFCFEVLSEEELDKEWVELKRGKVSFIRPEFIIT